MSTYASREEVEDKVDWEGGPAEFIFGYGFTPDDFPDDMPDDVKAAVTRLTTQAAADMNTFENWLYKREAQNTAG